MRRERREIVVVGSGFAATILARALTRRGRSVLVVERGSHPRFSLGESSTPLAAIALERFAARYDLPDLAALGAWGRLRRDLPAVRRGLKRGFTFWWHRPGEPWHPGQDNVNRLLVAASPDDEIADVHWMRSDVDHHLVERARQEGVEVWERTRLDGARETDPGLELTAERDGEPVALTADFVVDASGPTGFLAGALSIPRRPAKSWSPPSTTLIYGHFDGARPLAEVVSAAGVELEPGPYPDERAAVHHLLDSGWLYALRFDDNGSAAGEPGSRGRLSAGAVLDPGGAQADLARLAADDPPAAWRALLARYPTLAVELADATPVRPIAAFPDLPHRLAHATGRRWALLPHTFAFFDPMFSTGIAWSLVAVERLADLLGASNPSSSPPSLDRYQDLLHREADHVERLIGSAWRALSTPEAFTSLSFLYFAAASWGEVHQRLFRDQQDWPWQGFLGTDDPVLGPAVHQAAELAPSDLPTWLAHTIAPRNIAGLADPTRHNLYPLDESTLLASAAKLDLAPGQLQALLPRLRGTA